MAHRSAMMSEIPGITMRRLDYWRMNGVFGADKINPGSGNYVDFTDEDREIAKDLVIASDCIASLAGNRVGMSMAGLQALVTMEPVERREVIDKLYEVVAILSPSATMEA